MTTRFTTRPEMEKLFSAMGVEFRLEDADDCDEVLNFFIDDATQLVLQYAGQLYSSTDMNTST